MRAVCTLTVCLLPLSALAQQPATPKPVRLMLHGNMSHEPPTEEYLRFVEAVQPDILIMGVFDQRLYSLQFPSAQSKQKALSPDMLLAQWKHVIDRLHKKDIRLVGQMELNVLTDRPADRDEAVDKIGRLVGEWQRVPSQAVRRWRHLVERRAAYQAVVDPAKGRVQRRGADAVEPGSLVVATRRGERRPRNLLLPVVRCTSSTVPCIEMDSGDNQRRSLFRGRRCRNSLSRLTARRATSSRTARCLSYGFCATCLG